MRMVKEGTRILKFWKTLCLKSHKHKHWLRHYNWNSKKHYLRVLWVRDAYKDGNLKALNIIKRKKYMKFKLNLKCIKEKNCANIKLKNNINFNNMF